MVMEKIAERLKFFTDTRYRQFYMQRRVTDLASREAQADIVAAQIARPSVSASADVEEKADTLKDVGYVMLPHLMPPDRVADMRKFFSENACSDPYQKHLGTFIAPAAAPKGVHVAQFSNELVVRAPHAFEIANDESVIAIVSKMLGAKPTISLMMAWWSLPAADGTVQHAENFHRDVDDWRFVKLFCYLTDVDASSGPHVFVKGSHKQNKLNELRRFTDEEVASTFGDENQIRFTGSAGTAFLENTYGVHRATPPSSTPRLMFSVLYSLRPVIYGPKMPLVNTLSNKDTGQLDPFINRVYCRVQ